jgi:molybdopterin converting factor small subunit
MILDDIIFFHLIADMDVSVLFFGALTDLTGESRISVADVTDTESLEEILKKQFPLLRHATYRVAVNRRIIREKTTLTQATEVALLPPYSGG